MSYIIFVLVYTTYRHFLNIRYVQIVFIRYSHTYFFCIAYGKFVYISHRKIFSIYYVQKKCPYEIWTSILWSIPNIDNLYITHTDKSIFVHIAYGKFV